VEEVRWFEVTASILEEPWKRDFHFAECSNGEFQFLRPVEYSSGPYDSLTAAVIAFQKKFEDKHDFAGRGLTLSLGDPREVSYARVQSMSANELRKRLSDEEWGDYFKVP
jgi:hypothetical protein